MPVKKRSGGMMQKAVKFLHVDHNKARLEFLNHPLDVTKFYKPKQPEDKSAPKATLGRQLKKRASDTLKAKAAEARRTGEEEEHEQEAQGDGERGKKE